MPVRGTAGGLHRIGGIFGHGRRRLASQYSMERIAQSTKEIGAPASGAGLDLLLGVVHVALVDRIQRCIRPFRLDQVVFRQLMQAEVDGPVGVNSSTHVTIDVSLRGLVGPFWKLIATRSRSPHDPARYHGF